MKQAYLILSHNGPTIMAHTQASAMNAMFNEAAKFLIAFPDDRAYQSEMLEDADGNLRLLVEVETGESRTFRAQKMPIYVNDFYDKNLSANEAIKHYMDFLES